MQISSVMKKCGGNGKKTEAISPKWRSSPNKRASSGKATGSDSDPRSLDRCSEDTSYSTDFWMHTVSSRRCREPYHQTYHQCILGGVVVIVNIVISSSKGLPCHWACCSCLQRPTRTLLRWLATTLVIGLTLQTRVTLAEKPSTTKKLSWD